MIVASMFRNATSYLDRYFTQIASLREHTDVELVVAEGDSTDDTYRQVKERIGDGDTLLKVDHGGPTFGSENDPQRWVQIAMVARAIMREIHAPRVTWVEADLIWTPDRLLRLAAVAKPAVAPMIISHARFYDLYGFRRNGKHFSRVPPYYDGPPGLVKIDSCGSCFAADTTLTKDWDGMWPFTADGQLWLDSSIVVHHS